MTRRWIALVVAVVLAATGCSGDEGAGDPDGGGTVISTAPGDATATAPGSPGSPGSDGTSAPVTTQTPLAPHYVQGHEVVARKKWRDDLIDVALGNVDADATDPSKGILPAWRAAFGSILDEDALVGADLEPPRNGVSASAVLPRRAGTPAGPGNPSYFAFAVRDASGQCAGAVLTGFPVPRRVERITVPTGALCTAAVVARTAGLT